ncbi:MAG: cyclic nucleotide-binding domain-containing protein, partial [Pseudomonadota bacterium]
MAYLEAGVAGHGAGARSGVPTALKPARAGFAEVGGKASEYDTHAVVYYEGDPARRLYELVRGSLMLYKLLPDGRRLVVEVLRPGDIFGLANGDEHDCTAETLTKS